jgi:hypothetical protein
VHNYLPGADCSWLIDPQTFTDSISKITLNFDRFETNQGDLVTVYDGPDTTSPVLGVYSGATVPSSVSSTGNKMRISFRSSGGTAAAGWSANYSTTVPVWCSGQKTITADTADITDGSLHFNYQNNSNCRWMIKPASGKKPLTVYFKSFDTEPVQDVLMLIDPDSQVTLATISGHYSPPVLPDSVSSPSGKMLIIFSTNSYVTADGFHLFYPRSSIGIIEKSMFTGLNIFPNPVHDQINVDFWCTEATRMEMTLYSIQGQPLSVINTFCFSGRNQLSMPVSNVPSGIYLLRLQNEITNETYKIIITNQ